MQGVILAGGQSRRFGSDKALFPIDGVPMVLRAAAALRGLGLPVLVMARDRRLEALGLQCLVEPEGPQHPLWGLAAALERFSEIVVVPCDLPYLSAEGLRPLLGVCPAVAVAQGQVHPLVGHYPQSWAVKARELALGGGSARRFAEGALLVELPAEALKNLNTPP